MRHFRTDPIDETDVEWLLSMAHRAPSVGLSQPWRFVRVETVELRERLACHVDRQVKEAGKEYDGDQDKLYRSLKLHGLREAPVLFAVYCDDGTETGHHLGAVTMPEARRYSCVMAVHTLWLAAQTRRIGMGWVSIMEPEGVNAMLDIPASWECLGLLCLGRPVSEEDVPELERRGWEQRTDWHSVVVRR
ncbi:5,6-dimethylbenzimidazole synthase [Sphingobium sp. MAH-33]|uniref:5,6-dimethylbenzimidazole synthase n=1 Tax=Sphingobium agri TaxID=2933566 RepID=A0ABT0DS75_9SPHN|nr:5,6-dimethylbenzimidazole synthase [Sphingobium agri]